MNANTRKKQIKPKVTIDQQEGSGSKSKAASKRFTLLKIKLNRKFFIGLGLLLIFALPSYLFFKSNPDLANFTILKNEVISEQNEKIDKIETQISNNNQLLLDLERKDQALLRLESQMIELSEMLKVISEKNDIISNTNNQLMQYINSENQKKLKSQDNALLTEEIYMDNIQLLGKSINSEVISDETQEKFFESKENEPRNNIESDKNKKNIAAIVIDRIEKNVAGKKDFRNEVDLLISIDNDVEAFSNLMELSDKTIPTPNELVFELELLLEEDIILYRGDSGIRSKIFGILENQISIKKKNKTLEYAVIEEIKASIYNDNLDEVVDIIKGLNFDSDAEALLTNINNRTLYLNEIKHLKEIYDLS